MLVFYFWLCYNNLAGGNYMNKRIVCNKEELKARIYEAMTFDEEAKYYSCLS